jgi:MYXO-CTERM domain-containing protein
MTVAGVMSTPATYALDQEGPCDVMFPPSMVAGDGCSVSQAETTRASALLWALGAAALFVRRKRRG